MKKILPKKYNNFELFYNDGFRLAQKIKSLAKGKSTVQRVEYARKYINKKILDCYINIGFLSTEVVHELETTCPILKFSMDNMIKNCITHGDVCFEDYKKIPEIAKNPSKIIKSKNGYDVMLFKETEKYYKLVVKTTRSKNENFVKSFHLLRAKRYYQYNNKKR